MRIGYGLLTAWAQGIHTGEILPVNDPIHGRPATDQNSRDGIDNSSPPFVRRREPALRLNTPTSLFVDDVPLNTGLVLGVPKDEGFRTLAAARSAS